MRLDLNFLKVLKVPALLASVFIIAALIYYFVWVRDQTDYLMNRNFRLLATIGQQMEGSIESQAKIIESLIQDKKINDKEKGEIAAKRAPSLETLERHCDSPDLFCPLSADSQQIKADGFWSFTSTWESNTHGNWLLVYYFLSSEPQPYYRARLNLNKILGKIRRQEIEEAAFDSVLLAATDGTVISQQGISELRLTQLDKLVGADDESEQKTLQFNALSRSTNFVNVKLSGANYSLFIQPCCSDIQVQDGNLFEPQPVVEKANGDQIKSQAALELPHPTSQRDRGWVVCGLVSQDRFRHSSYTLSFSILALITALLLLATFSWPFLKLSLLGAQQRVRMVDVLLVGFCGLLGLSLIMILWLDFAVYDRLKGESENQLSEFAKKIKADLSNEIQGAYQQLKFLEAENLTVLTSPERQNKKDGICVPREDGDHAYWEFFFANADGQQIFKCSSSEKPTPRIRVEERQYFKDARDGRTWPLPSRGNIQSANDHGSEGRYAIESVRSWTTGEMRAVISKPVDLDPAPPVVAALSIPLRPLIKPFALPGFGFAVVDENGKVLFHSDAQRNLAENFFAEADWDRQLMAAVTTRVNESIDIRYWGKAHSAYVTPINTLPEAPWFLITFYDKQSLRTFNLVLLVSTTMFIGLYLLLYILIGLVIALINPTYRATWLWPASGKIRHYYRLSLIFLALFVIATVVMRYLPDEKLLLFALILPFAVWLTSYLTLRAGDKDRQPAHPLIISYSVFGVSLLALVAIWPTVAFFNAAYNLQMKSFVKYNQLKLARALEEPLQHRYYDFFNATEIKEGGNSDLQNDSRPTESSYTKDSESLLKRMFTVLLPKALEDLEARQPTLSAMLRGLLRDGAADQSWRSQQVGGKLELHITPQKGGKKILTSEVSPFEVNPILLATMTLVIILLMFWVVRYVCRRIFLIDLVPPILRDRDGRLEMATSYNIFLVCDEEQKEKLFNRANCIDLKKDYEQWRQEDDAEQGWRARLSTFLSGQNLSHSVFIDHFEYRLYDQIYNERKLELLDELVQVHHRTVVIFSAASSSLILKRHKYLAADSGQTVCAGRESDERWIKLLSSFILIDAKYLFVETEQKTNGDRNPKDKGRWQWLREGENWFPSLAIKPITEAEWADPVLVYVLQTLQPQANGEDSHRILLDRDQLLAEIDDRATIYYRGLWDSCTDAEKMVLFHLAEDGFVNGKNRKTIRRLMARRLIHKTPHFQLMSRVFRRFVLSARCRSDISAMQDPPPSAWDMIKMPFLAVLIVCIVFFFITQKELFNSTVATITGLTAALPALIKLISMVMGKSIQGSERA